MMGFERDRLPDAIDYYTGRGLKFKEPRGKWRTTRCEFHGGSDSMRINVQSGAFICMAQCGARGGDLLSYHRAAEGLDFIQACKDLGAWTDDGKPETNRRPAPFTPRQALEVLASEANLVAVAAGNIAHGTALSQSDLSRLLQAASRILKVAEVAL